MTNQHTTELEVVRTAAVKLMRSGRCTVADIAWLSGQSRQLVAYWAKQAGLSVSKSRAEHLERLWAKNFSG